MLIFFGILNPEYRLLWGTVEGVKRDGPIVRQNNETV
jgi:hypothetical protein